MALHQFDYILAIGFLFAFLDAFGIGANDVANSFATSVASRSLTYVQAVCLGSLMEFLGAVLAGSRVSDTIRNGIVDVSVFEDEPTTLMLLMACALIGSSIWLTLATKVGAPVSTTHSIVGAIIGAAIAAGGKDIVHWEWDGFSQIVASWFIAPGVAGAFAAILFLITKFSVMERKNSLMKALYIVPFYFALTVGVLIMVITWKGAPNLKLDKLTTGQVLGAIFGGAAGAFAIYWLFFYPYLYRRLVLDDWRIKIWHLPLGPSLYFWSKDVPPMPAGMKRKAVVDYYAGKRNEEEEQEFQNQQAQQSEDPDARSPTIVPNTYKGMDEITQEPLPAAAAGTAQTSDEEKAALSSQSSASPASSRKELITDYSKSDLKNPRLYPKLMWLAFTHGVRQDVIASQREEGRLGRNVSEMHSRAKKYDNKTEHLYSFLQGLTACTASFAHGSNDIANAVGPLSTIYLVWNSNTTAEKAPVPVWCLAYTAGALIIGFYFYGYHIMRNLGNKLTLQSPCRGFCAELGAAITTVFATQLKLPISTTQCIVGATVAVGLCNKDYKAVNWRMVAWCYLGWIFTLPCAGIISGVVMGIIINAPHLGTKYVMS